MTLPTPNPATNRQVPDAAIMDINGKQAYLGNQFVASATAALADTSETPFIYLANAAANTKALFNYLRSFVSTDATIDITFRVYQNPTTVTSGSAVTPVNCRPANPLVSVATCKKSVAVVSKGTLVTTIVVSGGILQSSSNLMLIADPGQSLLVTAQAATGTPSIAGQLVWYEL